MFPAVVNSPLQELFMAKANPDARSGIIRFGTFEIDPQAGELRKQGLKIKLRDQAFQVLSMLLERPGQVVSREELQNKLWPADTFVDFDRGLNKAINHLRDALGDSAESPRFIETLPKRGYRFIASVESPPVAEPSIAPPISRSPNRLWLVVLAATLCVAGIAGWFYSRKSHAVGEPNSVVVTEFENRTADPA